MNPMNQKSLNLDYDSQINRRVNQIEIFEQNDDERLKLKLKLTKSMIQNLNLML